MQQNSRPNFILIFPDQWRGDCLEAAGHPYVKTPYLDQMMRSSTYFPNAYSQAPTCVPARACLGTGLNPNHTGLVGYKECHYWDPNRITMMECLRNNGYQTLLSGKTHFFPQRATHGFEEMRLYEIPRHTDTFESDYHIWLEKETHGLIQDTAREVEPNSWVTNPWTHNVNLHNTHWMTESAIELLTRRDPTRPFFLQLSYHRPHAPYDPPIQYYKEFEDLELDPPPMGDWDQACDHPIKSMMGEIGRLKPEDLDRMRKGYYAQIRHIDYEIGRLHNWLKKQHLMENTYIIFTSDHGELLGDHCMLRKKKPFEGASRIPFFIMSPNGKQKVNPLPVTHVDIMPTLLDLAGIPKDMYLDGISLANLQGDEEQKRPYIHGEHPDNGCGWQFVTNGREKYIFETLSGAELFFDLVKDPQERHNAIRDPEYQGKIEKMRNYLIEQLKDRQSDGLVKDGKLVPGKILPSYRPCDHPVE